MRGAGRHGEFDRVRGAVCVLVTEGNLGSLLRKRAHERPADTVGATRDVDGGLFEAGIGRVAAFRGHVGSFFVTRRR